MRAHLVAHAELLDELLLPGLRLALAAGEQEQGQHHHEDDQQDGKEVHGFPLDGQPLGFVLLHG